MLTRAARILLALTIICLASTAMAWPRRGPAPPSPTIPAPAAAVGYTTLAFSDNFSSIGTIDVNCTNAPGYNWYAEQWFSNPQSCTAPSNISVSGGTLNLAGNGIQSAVATLPSSPYFVGTVFAHGAYFEASLSFDPAQGAGKTYWPSFWAIAMEHIQDNKDGQVAEQWPGQVTGYSLFGELDFFEACCGGSYVGLDFYYGTVLEWSGVYEGSPNFTYPYRTGNFGQNQLIPTGSILTYILPHYYGFLWVPENGATPGYVQFFYDRVASSPKYYFIGPIGSPPHPGQNGLSGAWNPNTSGAAAATYSIIDQEHFAMSLATAGAWNLISYGVNVWQPVGTPTLTSINSPTNAATVSGNVTLDATASDTVQAKTVTFYVDNVQINTPIAQLGWGTDYTETWNSATVSDGSHTLKAVITNGSGLTAQTSISVTTSNFGTPAAPTVTGPTGTVYGVPVATGACITGLTVSVYVDTVLQGTDTCSSSAWTLVIPQPLNGSRNVTATQKTSVSPPSPVSNTETFTRAILPNTTVVTRQLVQSPVNYNASTWVKQNGLTVVGSGIAAPDGSTQAPFMEVTDSTTNGVHQLYQNQLNAPTPAIYTANAYMQQGTLRYSAFIFNDGGNNIVMVVDTQLGTFTTSNSGSPTNVTQTITACPDPVACPNGPSGTYFLSQSMSVAGTNENITSNIITMNGPSFSTNISYAGTGQYILVWGMTVTYPETWTADTVNPPWLANGAGCTTETFSSYNFNSSNVDLGVTGAAGFQWYLIGSFGFSNYNPANYTFNPDNSLTYVGSGLYSIAAKQTPVTNWHGTAFGASGCTYYEMTFKWDPTSVYPYSGGHGWPAFWSDPVEHGAEQSVNAENWPNATAGYVHFGEKDFFEGSEWGYDLRLEAYDGTAIDWSGVYVPGSQTGYPGFFQNTFSRQITLPVGVDFTKPHSYGFLQVNATATTPGYMQYFFDRRPTSDRITYNRMSCTNPPQPPMTSSGVAVSYTTTAATAAGNATLTFGSTLPYDIMGSAVTDTTHPTAIPANTLAGSQSGANVGMTNNAASTGVQVGDTIVFTAGLYGIHDCMHDELIVNSASIGQMTIYGAEVHQASGANNITK